MATQGGRRVALSEAQYLEITQLYDDGHGFKMREIAEAYGCSVTTVSNIINYGDIAGKVTATGVRDGRAGTGAKRVPAPSNDPGGAPEPVHA